MMTDIPPFKRRNAFWKCYLLTADGLTLESAHFCRRHWFWGKFSPPVETTETVKDTAHGLPEVNGKSYNAPAHAANVQMNRFDEDKGARF